MPKARQRQGSEEAPDLSRLPSFGRLLIPLDGSRLAEAALDIACPIADGFHSTIVLLHVIERNAATRIHGERHLTRRGEAEAYLVDVARRLQAPASAASAKESGAESASASPGPSAVHCQIEYHTHDVPVGDVAKSIAAHADEHAIDLIVLCTHGEGGGIRDAVWGSIAQQVLQHTTRPVLLARARTAETVPAAFAPATIMVPIDGTLAAEAALPYATALARTLHAALRLVLVVPTVETMSAESMPTATFLPSASRLVLDVEEEQSGAYLQRLASTVRAAGVRAITEVRRGETVTELATDTGEHADGLVVIATHGRAGLQAIWTRSVAARLLRRTDAPILLVPISE
jgi:nucleotide-binding universal stress UspA family protein